MGKRASIVIAVVLLVVGACLPERRAREGIRQQPLFTFVQLTDTHVIAGKSNDNLRRAIEDINLLDPPPRFAVVTGDLIDGQKPTASTRLYNEALSGLECPVYSVLGNHDNRGAFEALLHPTTNYSFQIRPYHFIVLDSVQEQVVGGVRDCKFEPSTVQWLKDHLKKVEKDTPIIVFSHASPFRPNSFLNELPGDVRNSREVVELLEPFRVVAWFTGHAHGNFHVRRDGVDYFVTGCVSDTPGNTNVPLGYRLVRVYRDRVETEYRTIEQFRKSAQAALELAEGRGIGPSGSATPARS